MSDRNIGQEILDGIREIKAYKESLARQGQDQDSSENTEFQKLSSQRLERYISAASIPDEYAALMEQLHHVEANRTFNREEMNERR